MIIEDYELCIDKFVNSHIINISIINKSKNKDIEDKKNHKNI